MHIASQSFEKLESRRLLSAVLNGPALFIRGQDNFDDAIDVRPNDAGDKIQVTLNGEVKLFTRRAVTTIFIRTYGGNDNVMVAKLLAKDTWIFAGAGNDTIITGDERDNIYGGGGDDSIDAGNGPNYIVTDGGNDSVVTGNGRDRIWTGAGNDTVRSSNGADAISTGAGDDSVDAGNGNDRVYGGHGVDTLNGGNGNDRLWGQGENDVIFAGNGDDILGGIVGDNNSLIGGNGKDTFYVKTTLDGQFTDFVANEDLVHVQPPELAGSQV